MKNGLDKPKECKRQDQRVVYDWPESALVINPNSIIGKKLDTPDDLPTGDKPVFE